jgi:hypothetical protein
MTRRRRERGELAGRRTQRRADAEENLRAAFAVKVGEVGDHPGGSTRDPVAVEGDAGRGQARACRFEHRGSLGRQHPVDLGGSDQLTGIDVHVAEHAEHQQACPVVLVRERECMVERAKGRR